MRFLLFVALFQHVRFISKRYLLRTEILKQTKVPAEERNQV